MRQSNAGLISEAALALASSSTRPSSTRPSPHSVCSAYCWLTSRGTGAGRSNGTLDGLVLDHEMPIEALRADERARYWPE